MNSRSMNSVICGIAVVSLASSVCASPMLGPRHDGSGTPFVNWISADPDGDDTIDTGSIADMNDAGFGNPAPGLNIDPVTPGNLVNGSPVVELIYTTDAGLLGTGDLTTYAGMAFDFYAGANGDGTGAPMGLQFYFQGNGENWYYNIGTGFITDGWGTYDIAFGYGVGGYGLGSWYSPDGVGDAGAFLTALGDVDRIGIEITYFSSGTNPNQDYGIDDFGLTVPEPETYMVLGMALLTMAFVFRKRITESLAEARTVMQM